MEVSGLDKLKEKDKLYVGEVIDYARQFSLKASLKGTALVGDKNYREIGILVEGELYALLSCADGISGIETSVELNPPPANLSDQDQIRYAFSQTRIKQVQPFNRKSSDGSEYKIGKHKSGSELLKIIGEEEIKKTKGRTNISIGETKIIVDFNPTHNKYHQSTQNVSS